MLSEEELSVQIITRLPKLKISQDRYISESSDLQKFGYTQKQANRVILRECSFNTVEVLLSKHADLIKILDHEQIVKIAANDGGSNSLEAVLNSYQALKDLGLNADQIVKIAADSGGSRNVAAVLSLGQKLKDLGFRVEQIVRMAANRGGSKNLGVVLSSYHALENLGFSVEQIVRMAAKCGGSKNLGVVLSSYHALENLGFSAKQIVRIAGNNGGSKTIEAVLNSYQLLEDFGFSVEQIVKIAGRDGGAKNIQIICENIDRLKSSHIDAKQLIDMNLCSSSKRNQLLQLLNKSEVELEADPYDIDKSDYFLNDLDDFDVLSVISMPIIFSGKRGDRDETNSVPNKKLKMHG